MWTEGVGTRTGKETVRAGSQPAETEVSTEAGIVLGRKCRLVSEGTFNH